MRLLLNILEHLSSFGKCLISKWPGLFYIEASKTHQSSFTCIHKSEKMHLQSIIHLRLLRFLIFIRRLRPQWQVRTKSYELKGFQVFEHTNELSS